MASNLLVMASNLLVMASIKNEERSLIERHLNVVIRLDKEHPLLDL